MTIHREGLECEPRPSSESEDRSFQLTHKEFFRADFETFRDYVKHEDDLIAVRMNGLITLNSLLLTSLSISLPFAFEQRGLVWWTTSTLRSEFLVLCALLAIPGITISYSASEAIKAAEDSISRLRHIWRHLYEEEDSRKAWRKHHYGMEDRKSREYMRWRAIRKVFGINLSNKKVSEERYNITKKILFPYLTDGGPSIGPTNFRSHLPSVLPWAFAYVWAFVLSFSLSALTFRYLL